MAALSAHHDRVRDFIAAVFGVWIHSLSRTQRQAFGWLLIFLGDLLYADGWA